MTSEKLKMLAGEWYDPADSELKKERQRARSLCRRLNQDAPDDLNRLVGQLLGGRPERLVITPPFFCDYGYNIEAEEDVYFNANCVLLDVCRIRIGRGTMFGPGVHIYTVNHPMEAVLRRTGREIGKPVVVGKDVWVGGATVICPGISIGDEAVVGAGSVVTRDIPAGVFAAGNPCRVVRSLA